METQEKSRQKMQKDRLYWTVSGERCERPMKGDEWGRRWAIGAGRVLSAVWAWKDASCFWLCSLREMDLEEPKESY